MAELIVKQQEVAQLVRAFTKLETTVLGIKLPDGTGAVSVSRLLLEGEAKWKDLAFDYQLSVEPEADLKAMIKLR